MKTEKLQKTALLLYFIFLIIYVLTACEKETTEPISQTQYEIQYFVVSDSAYIQYNIGSTDYTKFVSKWDTLFTSPGGWTVNIMVTSFRGDLLTGVIINGDTVDGCLCGDWCQMGLYLQ